MQKRGGPSPTDRKSSLRLVVVAWPFIAIIVTQAILATFSVEQITEILLYHVTPGTLDSAAVLSSGSLTMLNGGTVTPAKAFRLADETDALKNPKLVKKGIDLFATNGVIHTIDRVLVPAL